MDEVNELDQLKIPPTEAGVAALLNMRDDETLGPAGKMVLRRLAFQRDRLLDEVDRWNTVDWERH